MGRILATIMICLFLAGCGKHYWEASGRGIGEFQADSSQCIQESKTKYEVSERIYRRCMQAQGWKRIQTQYPSDSQFRGPEDEDEFFSPPNPLSARGLQQSPGGHSRWWPVTGFPERMHIKGPFLDRWSVSSIRGSLAFSSSLRGRSANSCEQRSASPGSLPDIPPLALPAADVGPTPDPG
jgi:hypothetical protein